MKKRNFVNDCLNAVAEKVELYPGDYDTSKDYVDAVLDAASSSRVWGPLNASQKSAVSKYAMEDWNQFQSAESEAVF